MKNYQYCVAGATVLDILVWGTCMEKGYVQSWYIKKHK